MARGSTQRRRLRSLAALYIAVVAAFGLAACTDFVFNVAPEGCGFPPDVDLAFGGLASPNALGVQDPPIDPRQTVEAYVTDEDVELPEGPSHAMCLVLVDGTDVEYWVRPVADDWEYVDQ